MSIKISVDLKKYQEIEKKAKVYDEIMEKWFEYFINNSLQNDTNRSTKETSWI